MQSVDGHDTFEVYLKYCHLQHETISVMSKKTDRKTPETDSYSGMKKPEEETIRETIEKRRLQNSILQRIIKRIKENPGTSAI